MKSHSGSVFKSINCNVRGGKGVKDIPRVQKKPIRLYVYTSICTHIESEILSSIRVHIDVKQINV